MQVNYLILELAQEANEKYNANNWIYVSTELGKRYGIVKTPNACKKTYQRTMKGVKPRELKEKSLDQDNKQDIKETLNKGSRIIQLLANGMTVSERRILLSESQLKSKELLLVAHGFDTNEFELVSATNNLWDSQTSEGEVLTLYQSKITVKPRVESKELSREDIEKANREIKPLPNGFKLKEIDKEKETYALEIAIFDAHLSAMSWHEETGEDNDHKITYATIMKVAYDALDIIKSNNIEKIFLIFGGDFFQIDTEGMTTVKGTKVDFDSRPYKMLQVGYKLLMEMIDLLAIVETEVIWIEGNHSKNLEFAVFNALPFIYKNATHIKFNVTPRARKIFTYGNNLVGIHHGEMNKANAHGWLQTEFREEWGKSTYAETHSGHIHHESTIEKNGIINRSNPTMKPLDKYEYQEGYNSNKATLCYLWHKEKALKAIYYLR